MTSNTSNTSNASNASSLGGFGNSGTAGDPASAWAFADRQSLPFVDDPNVDPGAFAALEKGYLERSWSPIWFAWRALTEFVGLKWKEQDPGPPQPLGDEFDTLRQYAEFERADALGEILAQKDEFISYFMATLFATPSSHPNTYRALHIANLIGNFAVIYYKSQYARQRPSDLCPALLPPIEVPGHASYPSGHSTQAYLIAQIATAILPASRLSDGIGNREKTLFGLAARVARNREIAGLHYPSDTEAGRILASKIFQMIEEDRNGAPDLRQMPSYANAMLAAIGEWE